GRTTPASRSPQLDLSTSNTPKTRRRTAKGRASPTSHTPTAYRRQHPTPPQLDLSCSRTPKTRGRTAKGRVRVVLVLRISFSLTFDLVVGFLLFAQQDFGDLAGVWG
ncbi:MAG: hypothetical protein Q4A31_04415, partial [Corynebacterium sp.]|uniref:hypothetical protein n=1 Tax=Corynebacterium sp. TaxID=1720 RepID=UPI0026DD659A